MRVYHFISSRFGLEAIVNRQLKVARIVSLNDPFEYLQYQTDNYVARFLLRERRNRMNKHWGVLCFSANYTNPVQWAHYADSHRGMCLGFDLPDDQLLKIEYVRERSSFSEFQEALKLGETEFLTHMLSKKFEHWAYEEEYRALHRFGEKKTNTALCFAPFTPHMQLKEVFVGVRFDGDRKELRTTLRRFDSTIRPLPVFVSPSEFRLTRIVSP